MGLQTLVNVGLTLSSRYRLNKRYYQLKLRSVVFAKNKHFDGVVIAFSDFAFVNNSADLRFGLRFELTRYEV